jgi:hypothetical protein
MMYSKFKFVFNVCCGLMLLTFVIDPLLESELQPLCINYINCSILPIILTMLYCLCSITILLIMIVIVNGGNEF